MYSMLRVILNLRYPKLLNPIRLGPNLITNLKTLASLAMSPSKVVAEYAKSGRSSCKKCSESIASSSLRLGVVSKDTRGFEMTKWHHLNCFPFGDSESIASVEGITGFSHLKRIDQESVRELLNGRAQDSVKAWRMRALNFRIRCPGLVLPFDGVNELNWSDGYVVMKFCKIRHLLIFWSNHIVFVCVMRLLWNISKCLILQNFRQNMLLICIQIKGYKSGYEADDDIEDRYVKKQKVSPSKEGENLELEIVVSASKIKEKYKDASLPSKWKAFQTLIFLEREDGLHDSQKIAAFDFDGCLAKTSVKRVGADAWSLIYPCIPEKLQTLYRDGYKLVIFTNEANIERWKNKRQTAVDSKIGRLEKFINLVNVPIQVFVACGLSTDNQDDPFRKPKPGMWKIMEKEFNSGIKVDMDQSFYVGDAAGRPDDHSDSDIKFAKAIGLKFYVPEEYFISSV